VIKLFAFLRRAPGLTFEEFRGRWQETDAPVACAGLDLERHVSRYVRNLAIPGAAVPELTLSDFDGVDELWFESLDALAAGAGGPLARAPLAPGAERFVDTGSAVRLVAEESMQFDRGFGSVKFIGLSRRHPRFTHDEWCRYWIDVHGPLAHGIPEFTRHYGKYVHNYVLPDDVDQPGRAPEYDGIVEEWLESVEAMARCLAEPQYLAVVRPDELAFVDFARSHMMLTAEHVVYEGRA